MIRGIGAGSECRTRAKTGTKKDGEYRLANRDGNNMLAAEKAPAELCNGY